MSDDKKNLFDLPDYVQNFAKKIESVELPTVKHESLDRLNFSAINVELPNFALDYDCELVDECPSCNENCFSGAEQIGYRSIRCTNAERAQIALILQNSKKTQSLNVVGNNNQVNQLGDNSNASVLQNQFLESLPLEFIEEIRTLLSNPPSQNKETWIEILQRFLSMGGSLASLIQLLIMLT